MEKMENGDSDVQQQQDRKQKKHDSGAADLEKVTDYAEEREISGHSISNVSCFFRLLLEVSK
jgi:hypothetical protein